MAHLRANRLQLAVYVLIVALGAGLLYWQSETVRVAVDPINPFYEKPKGGGEQSSPNPGRQRPRGRASLGPVPHHRPTLSLNLSPSSRPCFRTCLSAS